MRAIHSPIMGGAWILTAVLVATACHPTPSTPRSPGLAHQLDEMSLAAERDSLQMEVAANAKLLADLQTEVSKVEPQTAKGGPESPALELSKDQRQFTLDRVTAITERLKTAETQLAASERRARRLTQTVDSLSTADSGARATIADLMNIMGTQRETMTSLTAQVETLASQNQRLADSVYRLTDEHNTAYYVVGTRKELLAKGVIVEDGHRSFPLIGRRTVQPARVLPLGEFTSLDRSTTREIPLPRQDRSYAIVSRQDLSQLASWEGDGQSVRGSIAIAGPDKFWEPSKYLIVVER